MNEDPTAMVKVGLVAFLVMMALVIGFLVILLADSINTFGGV